MSLFFFIDNTKIVMTGETFPVKEKIKAIGARWNSAEKNWFVDFSEERTSYLEGLGFQKVPARIGASETTLPSLGGAAQKDPLVSTKALPTLNTSSEPLTVSQFVGLIDKTIKTYLSASYWITGEISSFKAANNHLFFDLIDKDTSKNYSLKASGISCVLWAGKREMLAEKLSKLPLADGTKIKVLLHCDFRQEGSRILAIISDIDDSFTLGNMLLNRQAIVRELKTRGLYDRNRGQNLPRFPLKIALITAATSRAYSDFIDELKLSQLPFQVSVFDCNMQGENTSENVTRALQLINSREGFQCIVITRGGGSRLDLRWFDDLEIAKQIAYSKYPVLCAVGHFEDISIADEVSWRSEKTPTGAARFVVNSVAQSLQNIFDQLEYLKNLLGKKIAKERFLIAKLEEKIIHLAKKKLQIEFFKVQNLEKLLRAYQSSIEQCLAKGYAILKTPEGDILKGPDLLRLPKNACFLIEMMGQEERIIAQAQIQEIHTLPASDKTLSLQDTL